MPGRARHLLVLALLSALPAIAYAPAWWDGRLLGPGDGAALHYPLRAAVWAAFKHRDAPDWNPAIFSGMPLLAAYRSGAFFPLMLALTPLPSFWAFQCLVLVSLAGSAVFTFLYLRRLGAHPTGAYVAGLSFALGPYLVRHLDDTATIVAAPLLPLVLLAAEAYGRRPSPGRTSGLAAAVALLLLAGSPEAVRAGGALLLGRLLVAHLFPGRGRPPALARTGAALAAGVLLAAPQLLPTLLLAADAGRAATGLAALGSNDLPGATGLVLRYVSHSPAPALALAALPLVLTEIPVRVLGTALGICLALQWGRGPLSAPGALALVFDLTLAILGGLSLSTQWRARREAQGVRLRAYFLFSCLASAAALSISTAVLGRPLPQLLAGPVGILALSLVLYFSLASNPAPLIGGVWLLPLTIAFVLQPHGREAWRTAPTEAALLYGTSTRAAVESAMGQRREERVLTLAREWPQEQWSDLAYANIGALSGRRTVNGYEPMAPLRNRAIFDDMGVGGTLPGGFFRSDPGRLEALSVRWVQVPASALLAAPDRQGLGDALDAPVEEGRARYVPLPLTSATEVRIASRMSDAVTLRQGETVARIWVRLATRRELPLELRAGEHTGEWAYDRNDVRGTVGHRRPPVFDSWRLPSFEGHNYLAVLPLPGRYYVEGLRFERLPGPGRLILNRLAVADTVGGRTTPVSLAAGFVSDAARFREAADTPALRLYELPGTAPEARVVDVVHVVPDDRAVVNRLRSGAPALDPRHEVLLTAAEAPGLEMPAGARSSRAELHRGLPGRLDVQAQGPGLLVVAEGWDAGWSATVDDQPARIARANGIEMALVVPAGIHRIGLRYHARGLVAGLLVAAATGVALATHALRRADRA